MDLEKSSFLDFFSYLMPNQLYHKDKTVSVWIMDQTNRGKDLNEKHHFTNHFLFQKPQNFLPFLYSTNQFDLRPNCLPGEKLVEKPEGYNCMEDIRRNRYQIQRNGE